MERNVVGKSVDDNIQYDKIQNIPTNTYILLIALSRQQHINTNTCALLIYNIKTTNAEWLKQLQQLRKNVSQLR